MWRRRRRLYYRMKRRLLNLVTILSLLLFVAAAVLWVRSYVVLDRVVAHRGRLSHDGFKRFDYSLESFTGQVVFTVDSQDFRPLPPGVPELAAREYPPGVAYVTDILRPMYVQMLPRNGWWARRGFFHIHWGAPQTPTMYDEQSRLGVPHWATVAVFAVLPSSAAARHWRARRRAKPGTCPKCGYDLRATPGRCPECGTPAAVSTTA
jgi:hypothetical protein